MFTSRLLPLLSSVLLFASFSQAQTATGETLMLDLPRASQHAVVSQRIGITDITINYHRPLVKGRKVFGGIVPYGQDWRAGANEATTFVTTADLMVGGAHVPAGSYTIFAIPNPDKWTLIISKKTGEWGTDYPGPENDLARVDMKASKLPSLVENFTIAFDKTANGYTMRMDWETTRASVDISKM